MSARQPAAPRPLPPDELGFERIVYEKAPPRATITLNRPELLNAFDFQMLRELARACEDASWDDAIRVVVVTGAGRAFCVGANLKEWAESYVGKPNEYWKWFGAFKDMNPSGVITTALPPPFSLRPPRPRCDTRRFATDGASRSATEMTARE